MDKQMYGRMRVNPPIKSEGPVLVPCSKCKGQFTLEKEHKELFIVSTFFTRKKDGTLTPVREKPESFHRLCPTCIEKLKAWFDSKL